MSILIIQTRVYSIVGDEALVRQAKMKLHDCQAQRSDTRVTKKWGHGVSRHIALRVVKLQAGIIQNKMIGWVRTMLDRMREVIERGGKRSHW